MKKFLGIFVLFLGVAAFSSCEKCAECTTTAQTTDENGDVVEGSESSTSLGELCGDELEAADGQEVSSSAGGMTTTATTTCN